MNDVQYKEVEDIVSLLMNDYNKKRFIDSMTIFHQPDHDKVVEICHKLLRIFFPGFYRDEVYKIFNMRHTLSALIEDVMYNMQKQVGIALRNDQKYADASEEEVRGQAKVITMQFFERIPEMRTYIDTDVQATYDGDPAASGKDEIVLSYPGLLAVTIYRMAHVLFELKVPLIPRMMTEYAHSQTGIDINPGARIGKYFMIDHGTGIVIGATTEIGDHVKVYQGVTLGALSTSAGQKLHGVKRHPTIEDYVTIYSGASVLGGKTVIGNHSIIGSNVFVTSSIKPNSRVTIQNRNVDGSGDDQCAGQDGSWFSTK
ncbi:serine O-acetyltransferase [Catenisphaera adipataccumulans]|uniref:Serine O-acetyltransferase n=1 Tax=Catenisphaera adipataccumulans TaxID=700500 RepID=A0A7W8CWS4_9FIRM|nr:serine O-acetyltransferase [Catenisphaera adipataccumulans]MBB5183021.1 serine O-acetyltransferase [Catenisphaera adipataccumulans]